MFQHKSFLPGALLSSHTWLCSRTTFMCRQDYISLQDVSNQLWPVGSLWEAELHAENLLDWVRYVKLPSSHLSE